MEMKKYKIKDIATIYNGSTPSSARPDFYDGKIIWFTPKDLSDQKSKYISKSERTITNEGYDSCSTTMIPAGNILMSSRAPIGLLAINKVDCCTNQGFKNFVVKTDLVDTEYLYYYLKQNIDYIKNLGGGTTFSEISKTTLEEIELFLPDLPTQKAIAKVLTDIDAKIALNKKINKELEAMAKELYDYWFVQFDFPGADGKPYKTSGGKMVYNEVLKREIPEGWEVNKISSVIKDNIGGDWGKEELEENYKLKVSCVRGADIVSMTDLPIRYILEKNKFKLLKSGDMVVEISGGSPLQATGRCILISDEILNSFENKLICSNFCQALSIKDKTYISYFYHMWQMFYNSDIFFNFEGKTSGIKNFQYDTFVNEKWYFPPKALAEKFDEIVSMNYKKKCALDQENKHLTALREELLPLLMNGQVSVK
ncbi:restriction endonuclease subunit S [Treponema sp.]|uniref:restriction endonuclease subunit S n=1 Tax=Treponema sp. TaxID=166 RepID=UPI003FD8A9B4